MRIIALIVCVIAGYWFLLRPVLRRRTELEGFYSAAELIEANLWTRLQLLTKGLRTILWARFLMVAGFLVPMLDLVGMLDLQTLLPPIDLGPLHLEPYQYSFAVISAIGWVTEQLRKATTTPVGQSDFVLDAQPIHPQDLAGG